MERPRGLRYHRVRACGCDSSAAGISTTVTPCVRPISLWIGYHQGRADGLLISTATPEGAAAPIPSSLYALRDLRWGPISTASRSSRVGWTRQGEPQERVYDVAWSDGPRAGSRTASAAGRGHRRSFDPPSWTNTIGAAELGAVWTDPEFDPVTPRVRSRARDRDSDPALDRLRSGQVLNLDFPDKVPLEEPGARLHLADLVHAGGLEPRRDDDTSLPRSRLQRDFLRRRPRRKSQPTAARSIWATVK